MEPAKSLWDFIDFVSAMGLPSSPRQTLDWAWASLFSMPMRSSMSAAAR